jgi:hypothetical protein
MSKHPEKFIKDKELFKELSKEKEIKESKEHKEKEFKEHKDKPEKEHKEKDIKEHKDKPEKEVKEIIKDYKEVKEIEKIQKDKDKDAETHQPTGDPVEAFSLHKFHGKEHPEKVQKDVDKIHKDKDFESVVPVGIEQAGVQQAHYKVVEKFHKDFEKLYRDKAYKIEKNEIKEWDVAGPAHVGPGDPVEQRIAVLEATIAQLMHFIPQELRPDLSAGALAVEKRAQGGKTASGTAAKAAKKASKSAKEKK